MKKKNYYYAVERSQINLFREKYEFLSNFFPARLVYDGLSFYNSEAAYQAAKCTNPKEREYFTQLYGNEAKSLGRKVECRSDWEEIKIEVMRNVLFAKFTQNPLLAKYLLETGEKPILEGNMHGDLFWGVDGKTGIGENHLGKLLMELRADFRRNGVFDNSKIRPLRQYQTSIVLDFNEPNVTRNIVLTEGDVVQMDIECIVHVLDVDAMKDGNLGFLYREAGEEFLQKCRMETSCATSQAKILDGYLLPANYVICTVGPVYGNPENGKTEEQLLKECYINCLELAREQQIHHMAFPSISTGKCCFPKEKAAKIAVESVTDWMKENAEYTMNVVFSCSDQRNFSVMREQLKKIKFRFV